MSNINISSTHFQVTVPDERRGRTFGLLVVSLTGLQPLSMACTALMLDRVSTAAMLAVCGSSIAIDGLYLVLIPGFRHI